MHRLTDPKNKIGNGVDIRELPGGVGEKEECKHVHIKSGHLLKIRVIRNAGIRIGMVCDTRNDGLHYFSGGRAWQEISRTGRGTHVDLSQSRLSCGNRAHLYDVLDVA